MRTAGWSLGIAVLALGLSAQAAPSRDFAIAAAGVPRLIGAMRGSVTSSSQTGRTLNVRLDLGEISPVNQSSIVKVIVPLALRASKSYQLVASVSGGSSTDPYAPQLSDVGFGLQSLRSAGGTATRCGSRSSVLSPFDNDPALTVKRSGRASYRASLADLKLARAVMRGPKLSGRSITVNRANGYVVDLIMTIVPQYYSKGTLSFALTLKLNPGPTQPCPS